MGCFITCKIPFAAQMCSYTPSDHELSVTERLICQPIRPFAKFGAAAVNGLFDRLQNSFCNTNVLLHS
jgi:hypothetical protein